MVEIPAIKAPPPAFGDIYKIAKEVATKIAESRFDLSLIEKLTQAFIEGAQLNQSKTFGELSGLYTSELVNLPTGYKDPFKLWPGRSFTAGAGSPLWNYGDPLRDLLQVLLFEYNVCIDYRMNGLQHLPWPHWEICVIHPEEVNGLKLGPRISLYFGDYV